MQLPRLDEFNFLVGLRRLSLISSDYAIHGVTSMTVGQSTSHGTPSVADLANSARRALPEYELRQCWAFAGYWPPMG